MSSEVETSLINKRRRKTVRIEGELRDPLLKRIIGGRSLGVAELHPPPSPSLILLRLPPKLFPVDRTGREDYRIVGEHRDGRFAKSFFGGWFGVSLFCSDK